MSQVAVVGPLSVLVPHDSGGMSLVANVHPLSVLG